MIDVAYAAQDSTAPHAHDTEKAASTAVEDAAATYAAADAAGTDAAGTDVTDTDATNKELGATDNWQPVPKRSRKDSAQPAQPHPTAARAGSVGRMGGAKGDKTTREALSRAGPSHGEDH